MCTVTITRGDGQTVITMNRDELIEREEDAPRLHHLSHEVHAWYPVDAVSEGTWFGVNNYGLVLTILNRYQESNTQAFVSRGKIIPYLLANTDIMSCLNSLEKMHLHHFMPFTLLLVQGNMLIKVVWNGVEMSQYANSYSKPFFITSSSIELESVTAWRKRAFDNFLFTNKHLSPQLLMNFHTSGAKDNPSYSVNMIREGRHTKSITQVVIGGESLSACHFTRSQKKDGFSEFELEDSVYLKLASVALVSLV